MGMSYTRIEVSRGVVRDAILAYLRQERAHLVLPEPSVPSSVCEADRMWFHETTSETGIPLNGLVDNVYQIVISSGKAHLTTVPAGTNMVMNAYDAYFPVRTKTIILEEVLELVRAGVLLQVKPKSARQGFSVEFDFGGGSVMLTERGIQFLAEEPPIPYFAEQYIDRLRQTAEPDDELKGYLSEGLACLQHHLGRAAAVLLRLAAEHALNLLIDSTRTAIKDAQEQSGFQGKINKARMNIEERAEVVFRKLESEQALVPHREEVTNSLRPAFHSIRVLGGRAAHLSSPIQLEEVRDHYTLYASSVWAVIARIIQHQKNLPSV